MNRVQTLRSNVPGARPTGRLPGELYVNWPDLQLGVIDPTNTPIDLIAVRYFSSLANYAIGDFVVQGGFLYRAIAVVVPAPFTPAQWEQIKMASDPPVGGPYLPLSGGTLTGPVIAPAGSSIVGYLPLIGGTLTGPLNITGAAGTARSLSGETGANRRWEMQLGDPIAEGGANAGSDFNLLRYADAGALIDTPLSINRASGVTTFANLSAPQAIGDNRIINGDMRIDQRNNGVGGTAVGYTVDRWNYSATQLNRGNWGQGVSSPTLMALGFNNFLGFLNNVGAYTLLATDTFAFYQPIEADMLNDFAFGTPAAVPITLSFLANSYNLTGVFGGSIRNYAVDRSYPFSFSLSTVDTWVKFVITIPGDTAGTWALSGNDGGMIVSFDLGSGANFRAPAGAWVAGNFVGVNGGVSTVTVNGAQLAITGVKLEIGSVATPYNRQSLAKSMADCQRYYNNRMLVSFLAYGIAATQFGTTFTYPVVRATPTITLASPGLTNCSALSVQSPALASVLIYATFTATAGAQYTANPIIDAEL